MYSRKKQNRWGTLLVSAGAMVLFGLAGMLLVWMSGNPTDALAEKWADYDIVLDKNCEDGPLEGESEDSGMEYGSLRYWLNEAPWFEDGKSKGTVCFQNDAGNQHFVQISYRLEDGEEVYRSGIIPPDSHISRAALSRALSPGEYDAVCQIELFDMDTLESLGTLAEKITITVQR
ncbi:MAG: hypothetical protein ACI4I8_06925 [Oscillospiraceae bacterium]